jgi:HAD superfamily hydrolase (TIGR01509 family)
VSAPRVGALFDVGYCLMDESARLARALEWLALTLARAGHPVSAAVLDSCYQEACRAPSPGEPSLLIQVLRGLGVPEAEARGIRRALPWEAVPLQAYPEAVPALRALRETGFRVGVLANQPASTRADLDGAGVSALCDGVWLSEAVGLAKPDPRFFQLPLDAWGLPPGRVAYVGDRPDHDVAPARALGMATVRVLAGPHALQPARSDGETPTMAAPTLAEAVDRLLAWQTSLGAEA